MSEASIVEYFSAHEKYRCGYCRSEDTCYSHGMWAHTLTPLDYQNLIDRGWRRSGKYCYKPTMDRICCPQYTIRCEANKFSLTRSQKKVLKKVNKFLLNGEKERSTSAQSSEGDEQPMDVSGIPESMDFQLLKKIKNVSNINKSNIDTSLGSPSHKESDDLSQKNKDNSQVSSSTVPMVSETSHSNSSHCTDTKNPACNRPPSRKAKDLRRERKLQKLLNKGISPEEAMFSVQKKGSEPKTLENFLFNPFPSEPVNKLELRLVPSDFDSDEFSSSFDESYNLYKKYQMKVHNDTEEACNQESFEDFLVETPFERLDGVSSSEISTYGSFHQQYWLNDKLIGVGVIDILPYCVSSVYFYYDPDYSFLSLGTYAALREIALSRELSISHPDLQYYYMGFYIHSCVKMRYKGQYNPSYLLCPETYIFQPIEKCKPKLDVSKYHRLEEDITKEDCDGVVNLEEVLILFNHKKMTYLTYRKFNKHANDEDLVKEYAGFVGRKCYRRMLLFRS